MLDFEERGSMVQKVAAKYVENYINKYKTSIRPSWKHPLIKHNDGNCHSDTAKPQRCNMEVEERR